MGLNDIVAAAKALNEPDLEINQLVSQFAEAWWAEKEAKAKKDNLRKKIVDIHQRNGVDEATILEADEGVIKIFQKADSIGLIAKAAKELLTEEQIKKCTGVTRKGGLTVEFTPAVKRPGG